MGRKMESNALAGVHVVDEQAVVGKQGGWDPLAPEFLANHVASWQLAMWLAHP